MFETSEPKFWVMLAFVVFVALSAKKIAVNDDPIRATSDLSSDKPIVDWCESNKISVVCGDEADVLSRIETLLDLRDEPDARSISA